MIILFRKIIDKVYSYILIGFNYFLLVLRKYPKVLNSGKSINLIIENRLSVSRFGDGELMIIRGKGWGFQKYEHKLAKRLVEVLKSNDPNIAICIPDVFKDRTRFTDSARKFWSNQLLTNLYHWNKFTIKNKSYLDALFTRFYMDLKNKEELPEITTNLLKKIWDKHDLLIIEGAGSRLGYQNDLFENVKSIKRILCPAENAFSKYDQILELSEKYAGNRLVLIALGMTATVLAYDLAKKGIRAIDIGHVDIEYEWYRMKATKKVPVKNRYMNEVSVREFHEIKDEVFAGQVLAEVF